MKLRILKIVTKTILSLLFLVSLPYYNVVFYSFKLNKSFEGNEFYNPYQNMNGKWIKANFHAHSKLFFGLTNGENSKEEMFEKYDSLGYDLPCLSNYNSLTEDHNRDFYTQVYEHGLNMGSTHQLVFNAQSASLFDYPFYQSTSHKQYAINRLKTNDNLIALAHPSFKTGYSLEEMEILKNYDLMEIVSHRAKSLQHWDQALSSGKVVWAIANDDSHDNDENHCGVAWTMVNIKNQTSDDVMKSLKMGNCYATNGWYAQEMNRLKTISVKSNIYRLELEHAADSISLISDHGKIVATATNTAFIEYEIQNENTYVRAEVMESEEWNTYTKMYFNPVIRTIDGRIDMDKIEQDISWVKTIFYFLTLILIHTSIIITVILW